MISTADSKLSVWPVTATSLICAMALSWTSDMVMLQGGPPPVPLP